MAQSAHRCRNLAAGISHSGSVLHAVTETRLLRYRADSICFAPLIRLGLTAKAIALNTEACASVATDMVSSGMSFLHTEDASRQVGLEEQEKEGDEV